MKKVSEHIRQHLLDPKSPEVIEATQWSPEFERLMRNRLMMGFFRFGGLYVNRPKGITEFHIKYIQDKLDQYEKTKNIEMLVDIANLALVEFVTGDNPKRHFKAEDRKE